MKFGSSLKPKLIYVFRIHDDAHKGCLKVGEATVDSTELGLPDNCKILNESAKRRINQYTQTAGIQYELLFTTLTIFTNENKKTIETFNDKEVHAVLERSGIQKRIFNAEMKANEWFVTDLETVKKAIQAVKEGRTALNASQISQNKNPVELRREQKDAVAKTIKQFSKKNGSHKMLWNAKMRFGKTLTALQVIKECDVQRTLILTHRPVVDSGWYDDFKKVFYDRPEYTYISKNSGEEFSRLEEIANESSASYIYFASIQDMRGSADVGGKFNKNDIIFEINWDLVIVDEGHEGTQTELGQNVLRAVTKEQTRILVLSGTPFNLLDAFDDDEIYTWDYIMEQREKAKWDECHFGDPNPYAGLPRLNIFTYNLGKLYANYADAALAFNFREFFRTGNNGKFIHEEDVKSFLNLLVKVDAESNYPYSTREYRDNFRHSLWMVPGVKEAKALGEMLRAHPVFGQFSIVNVAGDGDEEIDTAHTLEAVETAMTEHPENTYTITLSCGRLTTGVSVKPWTAVFMLSGGYVTSAASYMQTIFRVQTPATIAGKRKEECYVFDFAPDRALRIIAETTKVSYRAGKTTDNDRKILGEFLNFCPIIGIDGSAMTRYDTPKLLEQLKKVYVERVVNHGFEDEGLYNDTLLKLSELELKQFDDLKKIIGKTKAMEKTNEIDINKQGLSDEQYQRFESLKKKQREKRELSQKELHELQKIKEARENRKNAISILRGISIRMPLLIYGADMEDETQEITIDNFADLIDDSSWSEFMPHGVTKEKFKEFKKYYDADIFAAAGKRIRAITKAADNLTVEERMERITLLFSTFRNPDKETVLTPWRAVNMHMSDCLGGWCFYGDSFEHTLPESRHVSQDDVTATVFAKDAKILEINSKSGLYPLYIAYTMYKTRSKTELLDETLESQRALWDAILAKNIFVICKTKMAKAITRRTLAGFRKAQVNLRHFDDLINQIKEKKYKLIAKVKDGKNYWKANEETDMTFTAIVGNPPYQEMGGSGGSNDAPVYQHFCNVAELIKPSFVSLVIPSRWFAAGRENLLKEFRAEMLNSGHIEKMFVYQNCGDLFSNVQIEGGLCYYLENFKYKGDCCYSLKTGDEKLTVKRALNTFDILILDPRLSLIVEKIYKCHSNGHGYVDSIVSSDTPFGIPSNPKHKGNAFDISEHEDARHTIKLFHIENGKRKVEWINVNNIKKNKDDVMKIKVFLSGALGNHFKVLGEPELAPRNSVCSQSFLYCTFETMTEASNFIRYLRTKFFRVLVSAVKITQSAPSRVYRFVPLQNFTENGDIDWNKSISEIDRQLYDKYHLSADEITFVEKTIKPME